MKRTEKEEKLYQDRLKKLDALTKLGINPYPSRSARSHPISRIVAEFEKLKDGEAVVLAGRMRSLRGHGGLLFGNLEDGSGLIQFALKKDSLDVEKFEQFVQLFDVGDFIEISGTLFLTKRGEKTVLVRDFRILAKSLRSLPEKWHGLSDIETRLRKRYLDMIANPEAREIFRKKSAFWKALRAYLEKHDFLEVDTPVLEDVPGGADASPFITHHNALDRDFYLRISLELPLKKIIIGGFEKIYEIGKVFRNEGISPEHLQDYLLCEFYWAYSDYNELMDFVEGLYRHLAEAVTGSTITKYRGETIDWATPWPRHDYFEYLQSQLEVDFSKLDTLDKLTKYATSKDLRIEKGWSKGRVLDYIWKKLVRPKVLQPMFLINHPIDVSPLAKRNQSLPGRVERMQVIAAGSELGNGFSELNDPIDQRERFEEQARLREQGDDEAQMMDESFIEALEYGMPPTAGFGLSERLFAVFLDRSIRETVFFPPMKQDK